MDVLITYDIATESKADHRRLRLVARVCEGFGIRVQKSVFECRLSDVQLARLRVELGDIIDHRRDSVAFYRIGGSLRDARATLGRGIIYNPGDPLIF